MLRYTTQLFGVTLFALALIWFAGPGDASQSSSAIADTETILWADTVHINVDEDEQPDPRSKRDQRDTFLKNVKLLTDAAFKIQHNYMEEIDPDELLKSGITGMLSDLDRFSVLMEKQSYDRLMESTHGKYSGLGMQIDARDERIVIISPIEGTPAYRKGLRAGDIIWSIDGESTEGMTSADAAKLMRGEAGTSVTLEIKRTGIEEPIEFDVERAVIELKSVNYSGLIPGTDIGYVRLSRFAEETSHELRDAISELNEDNASALIFDLRSNGGGLLDQAKETAELFLDQGSEIVYTRGRESASERHYVSERPPLFPEDKPVVILVDAGTASASEIVAGAVQDWDRGIIMGQTTYGKGLVQQIFPVSNDGSLAVKLTTAKYYVPSGRCIQAPEKQGKGSPHADAGEGEEADSMTVEDKEIFYTNGGRIVYGGGGIVPDVEIEPDKWQTIEINLERKSIFFDFAVQWVADHPNIKPDFEVTDQMVDEFRAFIKEKDFSYKSSLQMAYDDLKEAIEKEEQPEDFEAALADLEKLVEKEKIRDFDQSIDYIKRAMKREIVSSIAGESAVYEQIVLKTDKAVQRAIEVLSSPNEYSKLMSVPEEASVTN